MVCRRLPYLRHRSHPGAECSLQPDRCRHRRDSDALQYTGRCDRRIERVRCWRWFLNCFSSPASFTGSGRSGSAPIFRFRRSGSGLCRGQASWNGSVHRSLSGGKHVWSVVRKTKCRPPGGPSWWLQGRDGVMGAPVRGLVPMPPKTEQAERFASVIAVDADHALDVRGRFFRG